MILNCLYARPLGQEHTVASALKDFLAKTAIVAWMLTNVQLILVILSEREVARSRQWTPLSPRVDLCAGAETVSLGLCAKSTWMNASGYHVRMEAYATSETATIRVPVQVVMTATTAKTNQTSAGQTPARMALAQTVSSVIRAFVMPAGMGTIALSIKMSVPQIPVETAQHAFTRFVAIRCMATYWRVTHLMHTAVLVQLDTQD